ncbi:acyltransferase family protein [Agromyces archimandritae]|uniref:Acetyltransferase n=1 Tax=Agromyces archimandritae TaxID=2781962 RepID=A0A975IPN1_9MICO|nr:acyltransferase family protein [Agromyces archimandritae]QTX05464.1 acetyltransferase [Agromyces archimandritae]
MPESAAPPARPAGARRYPGLDGMRAIAVTAVLVYHLFPGWLPGGFLGVDVFFVVSGFLITGLLLRERERDGRIALRSFWMRRIRRLVPALVALLAVIGTAAWLVGGDVQLALGRQLAGAATFTSNWASILAGGSYFDQTAPELFRNLWSLAVEEQFYLVWPILLLGLLLLPSAQLRAGVAALLAAGSALLMAVWFTLGDPTRVYFGSDTHAFGLLAGAALALWANGRAPVPLRKPWHPAVRRAGTAALAVLLGGGVLVAMLTLDDRHPAAYRGGILAVTVAVAWLIDLAARSRLGGLLDARPLAWIGRRSYGIYLWHWPVYVLTVALLPPGAFAGWIALAVTVLFAESSYRFLEEPVRRLGFRGALGAFRERIGRASLPKRLAGALVPLGAAALVLGTTLALATEPAQSSASVNIERGIASLEATPPAEAPAAEASPESGADVPHEGSASGDAPDARAGLGWNGRPADVRLGPVPMAPRMPEGARITAVGDSVMLAAAPELQEAFPGIDIEAAVSRQMWAAPDLLRELDAQHRLHDYLVLGLGTNGEIDPGTLDEVLGIIGPDRELVLVNVSADREWVPGVNQALSDCARREFRVGLADWQGSIAPHPDFLAEDMIHPGPSGGRIYADAVGAAVLDLDAVERRPLVDLVSR